MIAAQKKDATHVAGIVAWNQLRRRVRRGEKGILILAPMVRKKRGAASHSENAPAADNGEAPQADAKQLIGFRPVYVWDISQTDGEEMPQLTDVKGEVQGVLARLINFTIQQGIKFGYSENIALPNTAGPFVSYPI